MSNLTRDMIEDPDNRLWDAPPKDLHTKCYFGHEYVEMKLPKSPTAWIRADGAYNLEDMR